MKREIANGRLRSASRRYKRNSDEEVNKVREMYLIEGIRPQVISKRTGIPIKTVYAYASGTCRGNTPMSLALQLWCQQREAEGGTPKTLALTRVVGDRPHLASAKATVIPGE